MLLYVNSGSNALASSRALVDRCWIQPLGNPQLGTAASWVACHLLRCGLDLRFWIVLLHGLWLLLRALLGLRLGLGSRNDRYRSELGVRGNGAERRVRPVPQVETRRYKTDEQDGVDQLGPRQGRAACFQALAACLLSLLSRIDCA